MKSEVRDLLRVTSHTSFSFYLQPKDKYILSGRFFVSKCTSSGYSLGFIDNLSRMEGLTQTRLLSSQIRASFYPSIYVSALGTLSKKAICEPGFPLSPLCY